MHRAIRWHHIGARRRQYALGTAFGASTVVVYHVWSAPRLLLADSATEDWSARPSTVTSNQSFSDHAHRLRDAAGRVNVLQHEQPRTSTETPPPSQTEGHSGLDLKASLPDSPSAWSNVTDSVAAVGATITGFDFASVREKITGYIVPSWVRMLPGYIHKLQDELSMAPWSLSWEIWEEAHNPEINPEITWEAN
ncbi:hypothetical protein LTR48_008060, partial [Friedmanniomyces endolithicus]